jgi:SAM-dependent methyltransferase
VTPVDDPPPPSHPHPPDLPQGDACSLPPGIGTFDAVLAANLLCRVPSPAACLNEIDAALNPGGILVLTSPFTWLEEYTDKDKWLGGRATAGAGGGPLRCADALKGALAAKGYSVLDEGKVGVFWGGQVGTQVASVVGAQGRRSDWRAFVWSG